jgi:hypothetical protein
MVGLYLRLRKLTTKYLKMGTVTINEFSTDGALAGNSDTALPTEKAVKTYVDAKALLGTAVKDDPAPELSADLDTAGFEIVDSSDGMIKLNGGLRVYDLVEVKSATADSDVLSGETGTIELPIPIGAWVIGYSLNNEITITGDGNGKYAAEFTGGITGQINGGDEIEATQNTKVKTMGSIGITTDPVVEITLTPNGTSFTGGKVKATVVYMTIDDLPDAE